MPGIEATCSSCLLGFLSKVVDSASAGDAPMPEDMAVDLDPDPLASLFSSYFSTSSCLVVSIFSEDVEFISTSFDCSICLVSNYRYFKILIIRLT